ncbi:MAG: DUF512 domain-containing protein [Lachnospiraceae bacterium]|nr:DUF512 domain-containing protein [Lachnospiraceae bacterium]
MTKNEHIIKRIEEGSIAEEMGLESGDQIVSINGTVIEDVFDYRFLIQDEHLDVVVLTKDGEECLLDIDKDESEDLGIEFENGLMDDYHSCCNKCIFCFIDQMPKGMRETLYFKDDDSRLSFLQGNYVTLTNMSDHDIDRLIRYRLEPINISFQTMNPELRCKMLNNRFAGEALKKVDRLFEAGIEMNGQIVLCKGVNDGKELDFSIQEMSKYLPYLRSVSVVPVGLSRFREGLYPLEPFTKEDACEVIDLIESWQKKIYPKYGVHFIHASDEWYLKAGRHLPEQDRYDGYLQLENGVGMTRLFMTEYRDALHKFTAARKPEQVRKKKVTSVTGTLVSPVMKQAARDIMRAFPQVTVNIAPIRNDFFGDQITVTGLITGQDLINQLQGKDLGEVLLLHQNMLRAGEETLLDDLTITDLEKALQVKIDVVKSSGYDFVNRILYDLSPNRLVPSLFDED